MNAIERHQSYQETARELAAVLDGISDPICAMATCSAVLRAKVTQASWIGFYRVVARELLRVGPYQGPLGCLEIPFGQGVCGTAARLRQSQLVPDVNAFPGHIACDAAARSELVVPVFDSAGELVAVLDLDSHEPSAFDEIDREEIESLLAQLSHVFDRSPRTD